MCEVNTDLFIPDDHARHPSIRVNHQCIEGTMFRVDLNPRADNRRHIDLRCIHIFGAAGHRQAREQKNGGSYRFESEAE